MRWTLTEFAYELAQDRARKVLFVEGLRDLAFWRSLIPSTERGDTVIYAISSIDSIGSDGGERGRLIRFARETLSFPDRQRVKFFADADYDRVLGRSVPPNVILTDFRDLEAYGLTAECLRSVCVSGLARDDVSTDLLSFISRVCRPLAMFRITSERRSLRLSFQQTLGEKGIRKFIRKPNNSGTHLDVDRFCTTLLQNSILSLQRKAEILTFFAEEDHLSSEHPDNQVVHGKDFINSVAIYLDRDAETIEALLFLSLNVESTRIRRMPGVQEVEAWVRSSA